MASSRDWKYDVFLSFRGEDTRKNIVSHLHKELVNRGIVTFKDDQRLEIGDSISEEIGRAIEDSRFALVILSKNYTSSKWCLDELLMIMDLHSKKEIKVIPIFYEVDPSHVRHQTGSLTLDQYQGPKMANIVKNWREALMSFTSGKYKGPEMPNKVTKWREALTQIASLTGKDSANFENEALMIKEVAEGISNQLSLMKPTDFSDVVGMDDHMERLKPLLSMESKNEVRMIGIWGMGGIGKTTIAKCLFDRFSRTFPARCFFENFSKIYRTHGVSYLRDKILSTALCVPESPGVKLGPQEIKARYGLRKVFVVIDNVDDMRQMLALTEESVWFGPGSRIIITTRDKGLLDSCRIKPVYEVKCLHTVDALQIFNKLAFEGGLPPSELHEKLSIGATLLAHGLPAAIEAYGLFFRGLTSLKEWDIALCRFIRAPDKNVMEILKISYDSLEDVDKNVFLHVACLFNGEPVQRATTLLDDGELQGFLGVKILADKCLIEISAGGIIKIHSLVDQTARAIVQKSVQSHQGRRVLWDPSEIYKLLDGNVTSEPTECMGLHECELVVAFHLGGYTKYHDDTLKFLKVYKHADHIKTKLHFRSNDTNLLSTKLRLLHWDTLPLSSFPRRFRPRDLVDISLHRSNLRRFWRKAVGIPNLRRLDLSGSENLQQLPDLSLAVNLEELITRGCKRLKRIPESISNLTRLSKLDVSYCDELNKYHITLRESTGGRRQIALYFSYKNVEMEESIVVEMKFIANLSIGGNLHIQMLGLDGNADHLCFSTEQQALDELTKWEQQQVPNNKPVFRSFELAIKTEQDDKAMSEFRGHDWMMKWDQQVPHKQPALDFSVRTLQAMLEFHGQQKPQPTSEFHGFNSIDIIRFDYNSDGASFLCNSLSMFPCVKELILINLNIIVIPDDVCSLQFLEKLDWSGNAFETLPETMNQLPRLKYANLSNCNKLKALPELVQVETVKLSGCVNLQSLFRISHAEQNWSRFQLLELWVDNCKNIQSIADQLGHFIKLSYVDLSRNEFETLPSSIGEISSLRTLYLNKCKKLKSIEGLPLCLKYLYAHGCESLETISLPLMHSIKHLDLSHCFCLKQSKHLVTQFLKEGLNEEDSPRFACFPGTEVPNYFGYIEMRKFITMRLPQIWPTSKMVGFDGCIMVSCERPFHIQFSPLSYDWHWEYESNFGFYLHPHIIHIQDSSEKEAVKSDHLIIIRGIKNISGRVIQFSIQPHLQFTEEFKKLESLLDIKACGVNLIWEDDQTDTTKTKEKVKKVDIGGSSQAFITYR